MRRNKQYILEIAFVAVILFVGIFIRAYHFGIIPVGLHQDEAMAAVDAKALADYGTDRFGMRYPVHFTAWKSGQMSVLLSYLMVPFIKLLGFSITSIRLPMLVVSCCGLALMYLVGRKIGGVWLGVLSLIMGCICPWHYMQSRWSLDCNMFPHVFLAGACLLLYGIRKKWALYVSMIFFGLCSYCYGIANYSVPVFLTTVAIFLFAARIVKIKEILIAVIIYVVVALPEFLTLFINMLGMKTIETPWFTIPFFPDSVRGNDILFLDFSWKQLGQNLLDFIQVVFGQKDTTISSTTVEFGPLYYFTVIFFVIGLLNAIRKLKKDVTTEEKIPYVILLAWFLMGMWAGLMTKGVMIHRINIIFYPILFLAAMGIQWCVRKCKWLIVPIGIAYMVSGVLFAYTYFRSWADLSRDFYYESYVDALEYAENIECDVYYISPDPQGTGVTEVAQILTMFCHEIDAEYFQGKSNVQGGKERLPYTERYHYEYVDADIVSNTREQAVVYLVGADKIALFSQDEYEFESFYDVYFVVSRKEK